MYIILSRMQLFSDTEIMDNGVRQKWSLVVVVADMQSLCTMDKSLLKEARLHHCWCFFLIKSSKIICISIEIDLFLNPIKSTFLCI